MTIVVTGASGFLGRRVMTRLDDAIGVAIGDDAIATIHAFTPNAVIHLAAVNPGLGGAREMHAVNVGLTREVAIAAGAVGARLVHVSTDVVHDGTAGPYPDDAPPTPLGDYARTKAAGEAALLTIRPTAVAVRTSVLWDPTAPSRCGPISTASRRSPPTSRPRSCASRPTPRS